MYPPYHARGLDMMFEICDFHYQILDILRELNKIVPVLGKVKVQIRKYLQYWLAISNLRSHRGFFIVKSKRAQSLRMVALLGHLISWVGFVRGLRLRHGLWISNKVRQTLQIVCIDQTEYMYRLTHKHFNKHNRQYNSLTNM